jgi:hypothetical protein
MTTVSAENANGQATVQLLGASGDVRAGGNGQSGTVSTLTAQAKSRVELGFVRIIHADPATPDPIVEAEYWGLLVRDGDGEIVVEIGRDGPELRLGGGGQPGRLVLRSAAGQNRIRCDAAQADLRLGGNGVHGDIRLFAATADNLADAQASVRLEAGSGRVAVAKGTAIRARLDANGNGWLGGNGADGDLCLFAAGDDGTTAAEATVRLNGGAGAAQDSGEIVLRGEGATRVSLRADNANMRIGGNGRDGDIQVYAKDGDPDAGAEAAIHIDGDAGDITLSNADLAEDFDVPEAVEPGTVMVMEPHGLRPSRVAYDRRVAGVLSGAAGLRPAVVLDRRGRRPGRRPLAVAGKVYCRVDAAHGAIAPGDLLTTSPTPGHAMVATNPARAFGAVVGKALEPLAEGRALLAILVALQ